MKKLIALILTVVLMASSLLVGCSSDTETTTPSNDEASESTAETSTEETVNNVEQVFNINIGQEPQILDPYQFRDDKATTIVYALHEPLFRISDNAEGYEPGLATDFIMSEDAKTFTVNLRENAKWEDGTAITSEDIVYSFQRVVDPAFGSEKAFDYYVIENAEAVVGGEKSLDDLGVKAIDEYTVEFTLTQPMDYFINYLLMPGYAPIQKEAGEANQDLYGTEASTIVSSGPFMITDWTHDSSITLVKNPNYWDSENVSLETVNISLIIDSNTVASMYTVGDLDFMELGSDYIPMYQDDPGFDTRSQVRVSFIEFNPGIEYFDNIKIREALSLTFDRIAYVEQVLKSGDFPAYGLVPPGMTGTGTGDFREQAGDKVSDMGNDPQAIEKANKLLEEGLAEMGKTKEDMEEFIEVLCVDSPSSKKNAQALQQMWAKHLDLNLTVTPLQVKMLIPMLMDGTFHSVVGGGRVAQTPDPGYMLDFIYNEGKWDDPIYTGLMEDSFAQVGDERIETLMEAEEYVLDQFVFIPQEFGTASSVTRDGVEGFKLFPLTIQYDLKYTKITK